MGSVWRMLGKLDNRFPDSKPCFQRATGREPAAICSIGQGKTALMDAFAAHSVSAHTSPCAGQPGGAFTCLVPSAGPE
jgi:hypothetical protein